MAQNHTDDPPTERRRGFLAALAGLFAAACGLPPAVSTGAARRKPKVLDAGVGAPDGGTEEDGGFDAGAADAGETGPPDDTCDATPTDSLGPYYTADAPLRDDLIDDGMVGAPLTVNGRVRNENCAGLAEALVDVWQCDDDGDYDNDGFTLRGRLYADEFGDYAFRTIRPGYYGARPRHIHVRVSAPGHEVLTTQLYFEGDPLNSTPDEGQELTVVPASNGELVASFDFVLRQAS